MKILCICNEDEISDATKNELMEIGKLEFKSIPELPIDLKEYFGLFAPMSLYTRIHYDKILLEAKNAENTYHFTAIGDHIRCIEKLEDNE